MVKGLLLLTLSLMVFFFDRVAQVAMTKMHKLDSFIKGNYMRSFATHTRL
jgi:hypothetical protein